MRLFLRRYYIMTSIFDHLGFMLLPGLDEQRGNSDNGSGNQDCEENDQL